MVHGQGDSLEFQLLQCQQERTKQAEYAVRLEDQIKETENLLPQYIAKFQEQQTEIHKKDDLIYNYACSVLHLLEHLQGQAVVSRPCGAIHPWLKEQGFQ